MWVRAPLVRITCVSLSLVLSQALLAGDPEVIPPEVRKQMDPDIRSGRRPTIATIRQGDIFGLRDKPKFDEDVVTFDFDVRKLSRVQRDIIEAWIRRGHNNVYLAGTQVEDYAALLTPARLAPITTKLRSRSSATRQLRHPVNVDCADIGCLTNREAPYGRRAFGGFGRVPDGSVVILETKRPEGEAVAGCLRLGDGSVYFRPKLLHSCPDRLRWEMNWWHWVLGLRVPGAAATGAGEGKPTTLAEQARHDAVALKNGDAITCDVLNESFTIQTSYAKLSFVTAKVERIVIDGGAANADVLYLRIGDKLSGVLQESKIKVKLVSGTTTELDKDKIREIRLRKRNAQQ